MSRLLRFEYHIEPCGKKRSLKELNFNFAIFLKPCHPNLFTQMLLTLHPCIPKMCNKVERCKDLILQILGHVLKSWVSKYD